MNANEMNANGRASIPDESVYASLFTLKRVEWLALGLICILGGVVSAQHMGYSLDDVFITYRYARNLARGNGFVYNPGERFLGTTAPLYGLLLSILGAAHPESIPQISSLLSALALTLTGVALFQFGRQMNRRFCGLLAGIFYIIHPLPASTFGGEMVFQAMLVAWAFVFYAADNQSVTHKTYVSAALLAIAALVRPDGLIAAGVVGGHALLFRRYLPWRQALLMALLMAPFLIASRLYYGAMLPGTLSAKAAQSDSGMWPRFVSGSIGMLQAEWNTLPFGKVWRLFPLFGILFLPRYRRWSLVLVWPLLFALTYRVLRIPFYPWYNVPAVVGIAVLSAVGVTGLKEWLAQSVASRWINKEWMDKERNKDSAQIARQFSFAALVFLAPLIGAQIKTHLSAKYADTRFAQYRRIGQWLHRNTPEKASVGYLEIGYIGLLLRGIGFPAPSVEADLSSTSCN